MVKSASRTVTLLSIVIGFLTSGQNVLAQVAPTTTAAVTGGLYDSAGAPVVGARILVEGPRNATTTTDGHGLFEFVGLPFGTYKLRASSRLGDLSRSIVVNGDLNVAIQYEPSLQNLRTIARVSTQGNFNVTPASITQVNPASNALEGKTSWRAILEQIPGVAQAGLSRGNYWQASLPDGPLVPMQISINGALPYETATLLDNMPLIGRSVDSSAGTGTNMALYPLNGFGSADVVRGPGASSPSIVDSIGGSFVLHAPGAVSQNGLDFSLSNDPYGGFVQNAVGGIHFGKFSAKLTYGFNESPGPVSARGIPAHTVFDPLTVDGNAFRVYSPRCAPPSCVLGSYRVDPNYNGEPFGIGSLYGYEKGLLVCCSDEDTAWNQHSYSVGMHYAFSPRVTAELFYAGGLAKMSNPFPYYTDLFAPPSGYSGALAPGEHRLSMLGQLLAPFPVEQGVNLLEEKIVAQAGRGTLEFAALQNRTSNSASYHTPESARVQLFGGGTENGNPVVFNGGSHTVTYTPITYDETDQTSNRDTLVSYSLPLGERYHAGASFVRSYYNIPSLVNVILGAPINFQQATRVPSSVSQTTDEARIFVGSNISEKSTLDISAYFANVNYHVQDPKDKTKSTFVDENYLYAAPRVGFVWRPNAAIAIRAAFGGGFAEAPLSDLVGTNGAPRCAGNPYCTVTLTNVTLRPETSFGFDVGGDVRVQRDTVASLDFYRTNLHGQFYQQTLPSGLFNGMPLYATQYGNLGVSRYEGILVDIRHNAPQGVYWAFSGGLTRGYLVSVPVGFYDLPSCRMCTNLNVMPGINFNGTFEGSIPYSQALGTIGYRWAPDKFLGFTATYFGNNNTYFRPAFAEIDAQAGYPITDHVSLRLTFRNITNIYGDPVQTAVPSNFLGAPAVSGAPYALYGEEYGPRSILVTTTVHI